MGSQTVPNTPWCRIPRPRPSHGISAKVQFIEDRARIQQSVQSNSTTTSRLNVKSGSQIPGPSNRLGHLAARAHKSLRHGPDLESISRGSSVSCEPTRRASDADASNDGTRRSVSSTPSSLSAVLSTFEAGSYPAMHSRTARSPPGNSYYIGPHVSEPCTQKALTHRLACSHKILTKEPELCARNCHHPEEKRKANPRDIDRLFSCRECESLQCLQTFVRKDLAAVYADLRKDSRTSPSPQAVPVSRVVYQGKRIAFRGRTMPPFRLYDAIRQHGLSLTAGS
ncbi:hypothetical protein BAUCODRAFT_38232 [Baudoinia panamericana UAMH 10762]|uniref:Uncharacterized protein n=1 Tax=Baudoinia panamericana (strain UAMH 10762) TaxID=717646 RepID=M2N0Q2_BAUPA|nr:uncharacterized protein BAUCODRAFT_38232 [Baudoinia panamericana UAMH 10762]EMC92210.1 hypothetical protein BAUCODRAFT_38232 [Baudoinia panamericana UAMH 10762]